jgi:pilus assembly protein CpaE
MAIFLIGGNSASETRSTIETGLLAAIPDLIEVPSFDKVFERQSTVKGHEPATVLVIASPGNHDYLDRLVNVAERHGEDIFIILISDEISASDYKRLVRTGGADWASTRGGPREVTDIIARRRRIEPPSGSPHPTTGTLQPARPVTVSFVPSAGGVGNTTLALETAIHLKTSKSTRQRAICIVDLDFQTSHICDYLDSEPRLQIGELSNAPDRLDEHLFESFKTTNHKSGIDVFAAPRSKFVSEDLNINALDALFSMIATRYNLVFIDFPLTWFSWTTQVIAASDGAIITGLNTIPNLRQISETLSLLRSTTNALQIAIALNRSQQGLFGTVSRRKHVERVLRNETMFFIANHREAIEAVNMGVPMTMGPGASKLHKELAGLGSFCMELKSSRAAVSP